MRRLAVPVAVVAAVVLASCGSGGRSSAEAQATPRSLAAVVAQHLPRPPAAAYDGRIPGKLSAKLEITGAGDLATVLVSVEATEPGETDMLRRICVGCDVTELDDGSTMHVTRADRLPGAGLGRSRYVRVTIFRDREVVEVSYDGPPIPVDLEARGDRLDGPTLVSIAQDPALGITTLQGLVDQGERLRSWTDTPWRS